MQFGIHLPGHVLAMARPLPSVVGKPRMNGLVRRVRTGPARGLITGNVHRAVVAQAEARRHVTLTQMDRAGRHNLSHDAIDDHGILNAALFSKRRRFLYYVFLQTQIGQSRMIVRAATARPVKQPVLRCNWQVID